MLPLLLIQMTTGPAAIVIRPIALVAFASVWALAGSTSTTIPLTASRSTTVTLFGSVT